MVTNGERGEGINQEAGIKRYTLLNIKFPGSSDGKESACNVRDSGSIPEWGRSPGEGNGNPHQYFAWRTPWTEKPCGVQSMGS